jgi:hypothetical protein
MREGQFRGVWYYQQDKSLTTKEAKRPTKLKILEIS